MNGSDFIDFAARLASQGNGAAEYRSAVSRAYYGCFHLARSLLHQFGWYCTKGANEHLWVQRHFLNCTTFAFMAIGKSLENLHTNRKNADYDLGDACADGLANARSSVARAENVREEIVSAMTGANATTIFIEMGDYRKKVGMM